MFRQQPNHRERSVTRLLPKTWRGLTLLLARALLLYYLLPVGTLVFAQSLVSLVIDVTNGVALTVTTNSVVAVTLGTLVVVAFGAPLAYWLSHTSFRGRDAALTLVMLPLVLPPIVGGMLLLRLISPASLGQLASIPLARLLFGVALTQIYAASPFLVVIAGTAFGGVDRQLEATTCSLGGDRVGSV